MLQLLSHLLQEIVKKCSATLVWHFVSWGACLSTNQLYKKCSQMVAVYQSMTVPPAVHDCALPVYQSMIVPYQSTSPWLCPTKPWLCPSNPWLCPSSPWLCPTSCIHSQDLQHPKSSLWTVVKIFKLKLWLIDSSIQSVHCLELLNCCL